MGLSKKRRTSRIVDDGYVLYCIVVPYHTTSRLVVLYTPCRSYTYRDSRVLNTCNVIIECVSPQHNTQQALYEEGGEIRWDKA
jgi:hypothetical protein